jgi:hypothetical protein
VKYFPAPPFATYGLELEPTLTFLKSSYPARLWGLSDLSGAAPRAELVICADVIEHLEDPNELLQFIKRTQASRVVISTPERDLLNLGTHDGPPRNMHHVREWNGDEFCAYIGAHFSITAHIIADAGTQIVEAEITRLVGSAR